MSVKIRQNLSLDPIPHSESSLNSGHVVPKGDALVERFVNAPFESFPEIGLSDKN